MGNFATTYGLPGVAILLLASLLGWIARKFVTGDAVSRHVMDTMLAAKDQQIADKDAQVVMWRAVGETAQAQTAEILEHSRTIIHLLDDRGPAS